MQHRLAVHSDQIDVGPAQSVRGQEFLGGGEMFFGAGPGGLREYCRLGCPSRPGQCDPRRPDHDVPRRLGQRAFAGRTEARNGFAICLQHRHIHSVERRSRHESKYAHGD